MDFYATLIAFFRNGGRCMSPIPIVMAVGVAIALERWFFLTKTTRANRRDYDRILPLLKGQRMRELADFAAKSESAICRLVGDALQMRTQNRRRQDLEA